MVNMKEESVTDTILLGGFIGMAILLAYIHFPLLIHGKVLLKEPYLIVRCIEFGLYVGFVLLGIYKVLE